jgi:hypothetical protein
VNTRILLFFIVIACLSFRGPEYKLDAVIPVKADFITTDNLGNCYIVHNDVIDKYSSTGTLLQTFSNKSLGRITHVDVFNPMKPMLFYRDIAQAVFLDNMMAMNGSPLRFAEDKFPDLQLVAVSRDNGIWIYTSQNSELLRLNEQLQVTHRTGNLRQVLGMEVSPSFLLEYNNRVYLNSPGEGIMLFDMFGTYLKTIPVKQLQSFQVQEEDIIYHQNGKLHSYNIKTLEMQEFPLPDTSALSVRVEKDKLYMLIPSECRIYHARQRTGQ